MKQLNVFCEGRAEQGFCFQVLRPHLFPRGEGIVHTLAVGLKDHRHVYGLGRLNKYEKVRKFVLNTIKQRDAENVYFTTLFDLYGLPADFPGKALHVKNPADPIPYVVALEQAFGQDINCHRFIPHFQLYEYETVLFADPDAFQISFENCADAIRDLRTIASSFACIEYINDGDRTAPSKRIIDILPEYEGRKSSAGPDIAEFIGLGVIRRECPHFNEWLTDLENLQWQ